MYVYLHLVACSSQNYPFMRWLPSLVIVHVSDHDTVWLDDRGSIHRGSGGIFLLVTTFSPAVGRTHLRMEWVPGTLSAAVKRPGREAYHSRPWSSAVNAWSYTPSPYVCIAWYLVKHRELYQLNGIALGYGLHNGGVRVPTGIFLFTTSRRALGPIQPSVQWVPGDVSMGARGRGAKLNANLSLVPRSWMRGAVPPFPNTPLWRGAQLKNTGTALTLP
jgi:hypothetical protein